MIVSVSRWSLAHKRLVVATWIVLTVAGMFAAGRASGAMTNQFSVPGREGYATNAAIQRAFHTGGDRSPLLAVVTLPAGTTVGSPAVSRGLRELTGRLATALPGARIASYASTGDRAFVSDDGRTTFALAYPATAASGGFGSDPAAVHRATTALGTLRVAGAPVRVTGTDALQSAGDGGGGVGLLLESVLGGGAALLVLAFVFASLLAFVPLVMAVISILTSFLVVWGVAELTAVSSIVEFLIALVGLGVSIDYSLLLVVRWREERAHGHAGEEAVLRAMATAGRAVVFSGSTVAIGLLAMLVLPVPFLRSIGYGGLLIPIVSVAVALTLLPIVLATLGARLDWPHVRTDDRASRAWTRWGQVVVAHRAVAVVLALAVLGALTAAATTLRLGPPSGTPNTLSQHGPARVALGQLESSGIGAGVLSPTEILVPTGDRARVAAAAAAVPGVDGVTAPREWSRDGSAVVDVFARTQSSATVDAVGARVHALDSGARVGGSIAQNSDFVNAVYGSFPLMIALITVLTFVLLARAFRSVLLPLKAVMLNVLSVAAAWGVLVLVWQHGDGSQLLWGVPAAGELPSWLPVIVFAFLFGLSMDYEVFILARMREEYDATGSTERAVVTGIGRTGRLVTSAALILFLGFVSMATAPSVMVKMIATGLGAGILLDATVIRTLLVPAAVALFGRLNWWLPRPLARALRVDAPVRAPAET